VPYRLSSASPVPNHATTPRPPTGHAGATVFLKGSCSIPMPNTKYRIPNTSLPSASSASPRGHFLLHTSVSPFSTSPCLTAFPFRSPHGSAQLRPPSRNPDTASPSHLRAPESIEPVEMSESPRGQIPRQSLRYASTYLPTPAGRNVFACRSE